MDVTEPSSPDQEPNLAQSQPTPATPPRFQAEPVDATRRLGIVRRARIRLRYRHLTDPDLWSLRVRFDLLIEANSWDLAANFDELNDRYAN